MSWSVNVHKAESKEAAKLEIQRQLEPQSAHHPEWLPFLLGKLVEELPECENSVINLSSSGHFHDPESGRATSNITIDVHNRFNELAA